MDAFGIGNAIRGAAEVVMMTARQTGRSTALLESLRPGDRVVVSSMEQARWMRHKVRELHPEKHEDISFVVAKPGHFREVYECGTSQGRTVFDHDWLEQHYRNVLEHTAEDIDHHQRELSGYSMAHVETHLAARESRLWGRWIPPKPKN